MSQFCVRLPAWLRKVVPPVMAPGDAEARMRFVVRLAMRNVEEGTGGPFAAAVFDCGTGEMLACAVNRVVPEGVSMAHAEMLALALAQRNDGSYNLGGGRKVRELVTSSEPCAMCLGAIPWSGVRRLVCGARVSDAVRAGFDEGQRPRRWADGLRRRGIAVVRDVCRGEAAAVLEMYVGRGGRVYNGGTADGAVRRRNRALA